jgi:hypothetical protein
MTRRRTPISMIATTTPKAASINVSPTINPIAKATARTASWTKCLAFIVGLLSFGWSPPVQRDSRVADAHALSLRVVIGDDYGHALPPDGVGDPGRNVSAKTAREVNSDIRTARKRPTRPSSGASLDGRRPRRAGIGRPCLETISGSMVA